MSVPKTKTVELQAPTGKFRVVGVDTFEPPGEGSYVIGDYAALGKATSIARAKGSTMNVTYVYNDAGKVLARFGTF
jgi:hypothetical protein